MKIDLGKPLAFAALIFGGLLLLVTRARGSTLAPVAAWQVETIDDSGCFYLSSAVNSAGQPRIAYGALGEQRYAWHDGTDWHPEMVETRRGSTGWYPSLALDSLDRLHISYYSPDSNTLIYAWHDGVDWQFQEVGPTYDTGGQTSLALDAGDLPHVAYWDYEALALRYAYYDGGRWQIDVVDTMSNTGQSVSLALALDSADRPHLCYYDTDADSLLYAYDDGATWQFVPIDDDVFYNGQSCDIALDAQDRAHVLYGDLGLFYARRQGSSWWIKTVDDGLFAGHDLSLALDGEGHPQASYTGGEDAGSELRYAYSNGLAWYVETADALADEVRRFADTSLALDSSGRPHIAYWDLGNPDKLKYAVRDAAPTWYPLYLPLAARQ
ncbi:MAG: hypothetical protein PVF47_12590 [Anaerolineae bacterium]|jgi:hypothetical protein